MTYHLWLSTLISGKMAENGEKTKSSGFSFGFSKKKDTKQLKESAIKEGDKEEKLDPDFVKSLEGKEIHRYVRFECER